VAPRLNSRPPHWFASCGLRCFTRVRTLDILAHANRRLLMLAVASMLVVLTACGNKQVSKVAPPAPPPPPPPTASIDVSPTAVQAGQSAIVSWKTDNATEVRIEPLGAVEANGSKTLTPTESISYRLIATGPGGTQESVARITVTPAASSAAPTSADDVFAPEGGRQDVFFDLHQYVIRADQQSTIVNDAHFLNNHPDLRVLIEGHCAVPIPPQPITLETSYLPIRESFGTGAPIDPSRNLPGNRPEHTHGKRGPGPTSSAPGDTTAYQKRIRCHSAFPPWISRWVI